MMSDPTASSSDGQHATRIMEPKYMSLSSVNVEEYVTVKLISGNLETSNYNSWKPQMKALIEHHQLLGYINHRILVPRDEPTRDDEEGYDRWMTDKVIMWWFLCTISDPKLIARVRKHETACSAWCSIDREIQKLNKSDEEKEMTEDEEFKQFKYKKSLEQERTSNGFQQFKYKKSLEMTDEKSSINYGVNVANFVPDKLQWLSAIGDTNYQSWREQMLCLITSQGLIKYINWRLCDNFYKVKEVKNDVWLRNNAVVTGWIRASITPQIASNVRHLSDWGPTLKPTAAGVWYELERKFSLKTETASASNSGTTSVKESALLYKAVLRGDWEEAQRIFDTRPEAKTDWIDGNKKQRVLHIAVQAGEKTIDFVRKLVENLSARDLENLKDDSEGTALHMAATVGNKEAAKILVEKAPGLCNISNRKLLCPMHVAAEYAHKEVLNYLILNTNDNEFYGEFLGQRLLNSLIQAKFFDIAIKVANDHPCVLQTIAPYDKMDSPLILLTKKLSSGRRLKDNFSYWEHFILYVLKQSETTSDTSGHDIEGRAETTTPTNDHHMERQPQTTSNTSDHDIEGQSETTLRTSSRTLPILLKVIEHLGPGRFEELKEYHQAQQLLELLCKAIASLENFTDVADHFREAIFVAAELGVQEVAEVIINTFPGVIYSFNSSSGQHVLHRAILNRSLNVFKLICESTSHKTSFFASYMEDRYGNNPLHLAAKLAPPQKLQETYGAALQMRHEMLWFKEVKDIVNPHCSEQENSIGKTPKMVFAEEHRDLKIAGEKWMKDTANSYVLVAVLIATIMFTGAITFPGGNGETGFPVLSGKLSFTVFIVSDTISLIASVSSLLSFLAILTSRYAEKDFLSSLPLKLMFGLASLFLSIMTLMVSFIATIYLVFEEKRKWFLFPLLLYACVPIALFTLSQYRLLLGLIHSTYDGRFFRKKKLLAAFDNRLCYHV